MQGQEDPTDVEAMEGVVVDMLGVVVLEMEEVLDMGTK